MRPPSTKKPEATTEALIKTVKEQGNTIVTTWTDKNGKIVKTSTVSKGNKVFVPGGKTHTSGTNEVRSTKTKIIGNKRVTIVTVNGKVVERTEEVIEEDGSQASDDKGGAEQDVTETPKDSSILDTKDGENDKEGTKSEKSDDDSDDTESSESVAMACAGSLATIATAAVISIFGCFTI